MDFTGLEQQGALQVPQLELASVSFGCTHANVCGIGIVHMHHVTIGSYILVLLHAHFVHLHSLNSGI